MNTIGSIARVRTPQSAGLVNGDGSPVAPFRAARLDPETPFYVVGEDGRVLYIRLLAGKDAQSLAAIRRQDLDIVRSRGPTCSSPDQPGPPHLGLEAACRRNPSDGPAVEFGVGLLVAEVSGPLEDDEPARSRTGPRSCPT